MKPVFVSEAGGRLYQTGYRQLSQMPDTKREFYTRNIMLAVAVSQHTTDLASFTVHVPFGDNKQWTGPSEDLAGTIAAAADILAEGGDVLTYCYYGRNRSGLVCALIIRHLLGVSGQAALETLRAVRRGAVGGNPHFVSYLKELPAP